ncbi:hypothetical protein HYX12_04780 [Candidatus Woesearchaeota archaeon]|nr:hypothetical protein [Candidatus Woesearchaeota archaeon]
MVINTGQEVAKDITGKIIGESIKFVSSTAIGSLAPGEEDSLTVKVNILKSGLLTSTLKLGGKSFPLELTVIESVKYDKQALQTRLNELKLTFQEIDSLYYDKKSQDYLVSEIFESIKSAKERLQDAQQQILTNELSKASVSLDLLATMTEDISTDLQNAKQKEVTPLQWLKENALAITAIVAALGTLSGILVKATRHAKKIGENVKHKISKKTEKKGHEEKAKEIEEPESKSDEEEKEDKKEEEEESKD